MKFNFSLFPNKNKAVENSPDFWLAKGDLITITEPGTYRLVGWKKLGKDGVSPYLSCVLEAVEAPPEMRQQQAAPPSFQPGRPYSQQLGPGSYGRSPTMRPQEVARRTAQPMPPPTPPPQAMDDLPF